MGQVIIALDFPHITQADAFLDHWRELDKPFIKVGYALFFAAGPGWIAEKKEEGYPIFLDLKLHDIPQTVANAVTSIGRLEVDLLTLHAGGGTAMMKAAREASEAYNKRMRLVAVTQLTSTDQQIFNEELGIPGSVEEGVIRYAQLANQSGVDGIVCSGHEVERVKRAISSSFLAVTPGIRLQQVESEDQRRVSTPSHAIKAGADYLVIGRPITQAPDPVTVYRAINQEFKQAAEALT